MNPDIFIALGINSNNVFEPRPKAKFENIQVKVEPSTLLEDFAASSIAAGKNILEYTGLRHFIPNLPSKLDHCSGKASKRTQISRQI